VKATITCNIMILLENKIEERLLEESIVYRKV